MHMIKWIYDKILLEHQEGLFIICMIIIIMIILATIFLVNYELRKNKHVN